MRVYLFAILYLLIGCASNREKNYQPQPITGVFTTYKPNHVERVIIQKNTKAEVFPLPATMLYLRKDGTYVFGFCDNQISQAGKYKVAGDSILLYDRYALDSRLDTAATYIYYNKKYNVLCFMRHQKNGEEVNKVIPMKKNHKHAHVGFLREQEMSYDSIISYYQRHSVDEQIQWTDSVKQSLAKVKQ